MAFMFYNCSLDAIAACHHDHWPSSRTPRWTAHRPWKRHKIHGVMERTAYLLCLYKTIQNLYNSRQDILLSISLSHTKWSQWISMVCQLVFQRQDTSSGHAENHMTMVDPCLIHPLLPVLVLVELVNQGLHLLLIPGTEGQKDLKRPGLPRSGRCTGDRKRFSKEKKDFKGKSHDQGIMSFHIKMATAWY